MLSPAVCVFTLIFGVTCQNIPLSLMPMAGLRLFLYRDYSSRTGAALEKRLGIESRGREWTQQGFYFKGIEDRSPLFIRGREDSSLAHFFISSPMILRFYTLRYFIFKAAPLFWHSPQPPDIPLKNNK